MGINFDNFHAVRAQSAFGAVLLLSGGVTPRDSVLMCKKDVLYLDGATKQPVHPSQKSLSLFSQLLKVYTSVDDWILDGTGVIGKSLYRKYSHLVSMPAYSSGQNELSR